MILSFVIAGVIAPVGLAWIKGDGWLVRMGFKDSTGAAVVYMCGGVCGYVGNLILGPRFGIFSKTASHLKKNTVQMQRMIERKQRRDQRIEMMVSPMLGTTNRTMNSMRYDPSNYSKYSLEKRSKETLGENDLRQFQIPAPPS